MSTREKIMVTGANGQLGLSIRDIAPAFPQYEFIFLSKDDLPVTDHKALSTSFATHSPQWLINCAAYTAVDRAEAEKDLAMQVNAEAVGMMAAITREQHCGFIHISTDYVFDGNDDQPYKEDHPTSPQNIYGLTKLEGEKKAIEFNADTIIIRSSWIYSEHGRNFVKTMIRLMAEKKEINVVNDQYGNPTYARDLGEAILEIIRKSHQPLAISHQPSFLHFANRGILSWYDFALGIKELTNSNCIVYPIPTSQYPTPARRPHYSALDTKKIEIDFGIVIKDWKTSLAECIKRMH